MAVWLFEARAWRYTGPGVSDGASMTGGAGLGLAWVGWWRAWAGRAGMSWA